MQTIEMSSTRTETSAHRHADHRDAIILYRDKGTQTGRPFCTETRAHRHADHRDAIIM